MLCYWGNERVGQNTVCYDKMNGVVEEKVQREGSPVLQEQGELGKYNGGEKSKHCSAREGIRGVATSFEKLLCLCPVSSSLRVVSYVPEVELVLSVFHITSSAVLNHKQLIGERNVGNCRIDR